MSITVIMTTMLLQCVQRTEGRELQTFQLCHDLSCIIIIIIIVIITVIISIIIIVIITVIMLTMLLRRCVHAGHGGPSAADFVKKTLFVKLEQHPSFPHNMEEALSMPLKPSAKLPARSCAPCVDRVLGTTGLGDCSLLSRNLT
jgi:hypothetical protein